MTTAWERAEDGPAAGLQAAITGFGQFALECSDITATVERALQVGAELLHAAAAALILFVEEDRAELVRCWRSPAATARDGARCPVPGEDLTVPAEILARTERLARPLAIGDWRAEPLLEQSLAVLLPGMCSSLLVGTSSHGRTYGLVVVDTVSRTFADVEIDAVRAVAHLLSAAMDRHRNGTAQAAVAAFGAFALESRSVETTAQRGVELVTQVLEVSIGFLARVAAPDRLEVVYGCGPLGEPFGGQITLAGPLIGSLSSTQPLRAGRLLRLPGRVPAGSGQDDAASLTVGVGVEGDVYRLGVTETETRTFTDSDIDFLSSIAHLLGAALKRDRGEALLRERSNALQQALLPGRLPVLDGIEATARYVPAGSDEVGGDWYDVLPLPGGGVGLVMGDVEGHDSAAAAVMGQVRNVLRAYVAEGHPPTEVVAKVNRFVAGHADCLVSCCYAELRPEDLTVTCVSAGHPRPFVLEGDGSWWTLPSRRGLLLGVDAGHAYEEETTVLPPECSLLLVTDGLVDEASSAIYPNDEVFGAFLATLAAQPPERIADALVARSSWARPPRDDAALLVVRLTPSDTASDSDTARVFTASPAANPAARRYVVDLLTQWGMGDLCDTAALAVSELVTNAVMHTTSQVRLTVNRLTDGVRIGVHDTNDRMPVRPEPSSELAPGGRGLAIIDQIAARWGTVPTPGTGGKTVWLELVRPSAPAR